MKVSGAIRERLRSRQGVREQDTILLFFINHCNNDSDGNKYNDADEFDDDNDKRDDNDCDDDDDDDEDDDDNDRIIVLGLFLSIIQF